MPIVRSIRNPRHTSDALVFASLAPTLSASSSHAYNSALSSNLIGAALASIQPYPFSSPTKKRKSDDHIPRPPNAFILYRSYVIKRKKIPANITHQGEISRAAASEWRREPPAVKKLFQVLAEEAKRQHKLYFPDYRYLPERDKRPEKTPKASPRRRSRSVWKVQLSDARAGAVSHSPPPCSSSIGISLDASQVHSAPDRTPSPEQASFHGLLPCEQDRLLTPEWTPSQEPTFTPEEFARNYIYPLSPPPSASDSFSPHLLLAQFNAREDDNPTTPVLADTSCDGLTYPSAITECNSAAPFQYADMNIDFAFDLWNYPKPAQTQPPPVDVHAIMSSIHPVSPNACGVRQDHSDMRVGQLDILSGPGLGCQDVMDGLSFGPYDAAFEELMHEYVEDAWA